MTKQEIALQLTFKLLDNKDAISDLEHQINSQGDTETNYNLLRAKEIVNIYSTILKSLE